MNNLPHVWPGQPNYQDLVLLFQNLLSVSCTRILQFVSNWRTTHNLQKIIIYEGIVIVLGRVSHGKPGEKAKSGIEQRKGIKSATALCKPKSKLCQPEFAFITRTSVV